MIDGHNIYVSDSRMLATYVPPCCEIETQHSLSVSLNYTTYRLYTNKQTEQSSNRVSWVDTLYPFFFFSFTNQYIFFKFLI